MTIVHLMNMSEHDARTVLRQHPEYTIGEPCAYAGISLAKLKAGNVVGVYGPDPTIAAAEDAKQGRLFE